jgi:hypothetical protein
VTDFQALRAFVEAGGTLYCSYDGLAVDGFEELFGVDIVCSSVPQGDAWSLHVPGRESPLSGPLPSPISPLHVKRHLSVSARSAKGMSSSLLVNEYGQGHAVLVTIPFEFCLAMTPYAFEHGCQPYHEVYSFVGKLAGIKGMQAEANPAVETREFSSGARRVIVLANHEPHVHTVSVIVPGGAAQRAWSWRRNAPVRLEEGVLRLKLGPSEGDIVEIT